jgi:tripartite-type tricarboxylate transporter receptor subunit TctC
MIPRQAQRSAPTLLLAALALSGAAAAQPIAGGKTITIVVPAPPAGGSDLTARLFADRLGKLLQQTVVVDNRAGANGSIGTDYVAKGPSDGTRILLTYTAAMVINPALYKKLPYDPVKDFAPVAQVGRGGNLVLARKDLPVNSLQELAAYAKAHPDKLSYCSWGNGSGGHLVMEYIKKQAGIQISHVPYKGVMPCVQDVLGGQVDVGTADASTAMEFVKAGRIRALAYTSATRLPALPDVPTLTQVGFPFHIYAWYGFFAPAKTPSATVRRLNEAINSAQRDPAVVKRLQELGFTDLPRTTPEEFGSTVRKDLQEWGALVKSVGISID